MSEKITTPRVEPNYGTDLNKVILGQYTSSDGVTHTVTAQDITNNPDRIDWSHRRKVLSALPPLANPTALKDYFRAHPDLAPFVHELFDNPHGFIDVVIPQLYEAMHDDGRRVLGMLMVEIGKDLASAPNQ